MARDREPAVHALSSERDALAIEVARLTPEVARWRDTWAAADRDLERANASRDRLVVELEEVQRQAEGYRLACAVRAVEQARKLEAADRALVEALTARDGADDAADAAEQKLAAVAKALDYPAEEGDTIEAWAADTVRSYEATIEEAEAARSAWARLRAAIQSAAPLTCMDGATLEARGRADALRLVLGVMDAIEKGGDAAAGVDGCGVTGGAKT